MAALESGLITETQIGGEPVRIGPIDSDDLAREREFVQRLSPESRHFRFLGGVAQLSEQALKSLCSIDYDSEMAFIATIQKAGKEQEIGVSRYARDDDGGACECAVTVSDEWQHKGLGRALFDKLIDFARDNGDKALYSIDLADNTHMQAFGFVGPLVLATQYARI